MPTPMKTVLFLLAWLAFADLAKAQKENNVWVGGDNMGLDFNNGSPVVFQRDNHNFWRTNASVCDSNGSLLFYTNGYYIFNKNYQVMQNGGSLDIGDYVQWGYNQLAIHDGAAIVPKPGDPGKYYVFHVDINVTAYDTFNTLMPTHLYRCTIDMSLAGGLGGVVSGQKDVLVTTDTLPRVGFKIVKHANGRDYWLIYHEAGTDIFKRFLVDPTGVHGPYSQSIGFVLNSQDDLFSNSPFEFTRDGSKAAQLSTALRQVYIYDFDRCTGLFYNEQSFQADDSLYYFQDVEFSPSGRYLYLSAQGGDHLWQYDLNASDIYDSGQLVGLTNGALSFSNDFDAMCLGPDGKIYVSTYDGTETLHVINNPDSAGMQCNVVMNAVQLNPPGLNWSGLPNEVNYSLGALVGSGCDTLTAVNKLSTSTFTFDVYPNPFSNELQVSVSGLTTKALVEVLDVLGRKVYSTTGSPVNGFIHQAVDLSQNADGVYVVTLDANGSRFSKVVVKR